MRSLLFLMPSLMFPHSGIVWAKDVSITESTFSFDGVSLSLADGVNTHSNVHKQRYVQNTDNCRPTKIGSVWLTAEKNETFLWSSLASNLPNNIAYCSATQDKEWSVITHVASDHNSVFPSLNRLMAELRKRGMEDTL